MDSSAIDCNNNDNNDQLPINVDQPPLNIALTNQQTVRKCSLCGHVGHNKRTCPLKPTEGKYSTEFYNRSQNTLT
jgi:hypothetical protein